MERLRTAWIGCGKVGQIHAAALSTSPESEFIAVCDASRERAETLASRHGTRAFTDIGALLAEAGAQAVVICTPHPLHAGPAIRAAEAGAHVLVEKPMAASLADCNAMLAAAQRTGVKLGVVSQRRLYEPVRRMRAAIDAGKIGRPVLGASQMFSCGIEPITIGPLAREVRHGRGRRAGQPVAPPARPAPVAPRRGRGGQRLLGQSQPPRDRGR